VSGGKNDAGGVNEIAVEVGDSNVESSGVAVAGGCSVEGGKLQATVARTHTTTANSMCLCVWVVGSLRSDKCLSQPIAYLSNDQTQPR
jgi:hypothetical protein